ncbi:flagellar basal body L-ring protein FlgH [Pseudoduganella namucuonensis]|uniref:Flagellar L-ring protein n=1 Tax=Pseudoduganella namucuonensis TaxID=1035707 RepID=A0A1I7KZX5_9BURK|nr:flagellar basal body L-ring protein FlgH [Pseudoduganella namucuonensis]SFV03033.1 flagellar L-ring protein precursor FlgH [Pseudoduganella namucuonensis]
MKSLILVTAVLALAGCGTVPTTIVQQPTTARPLSPAQMPAPSNGAIFQAQLYRPHFEDRRARQVGDVINIVITERTSAVKAGTSSGNKTGSVNFGIPGPLQGKLGTNVATSAENTYGDADNQSASNTFTGTMGATVMEVLPNGNLIVVGEKQVAMNKGTEFIRFSGMVNPDTIGAGNSVLSTAVADARVEYRTNSQIDRAEMNSMVSRFFLSLLPF